MNNKWTPILAAPLMLVVAAVFGLAVFRVGGRMGYPLWGTALAGLFAALFAWKSCRGRYDRLCARRREGGGPPLADLGRLLVRQELLLLLALAAALAGYGLAAAVLPADPLSALGLIEPRQATASDPSAWHPRELWRWLVGLLFGTAASHVLGGLLFPDHPFEPFSRGRRLRPFAEAERAADDARPDEDPGLSWGWCRLPSAVATLHWLVCGTTGSGKTLLQRLLMQDALSHIRPGSDARALVYDAKHDVVSLLAGMRLPCPVKILNPMDARSVAWDVARDCNTPAAAVQLSHVLIADGDAGPNAFFTKGARDLLAGVILALVVNSPGRWSLRDMVLAFADADTLRALLARSPHTADRLKYFDDPRTLANLLATLAAELAPFVPIAAAWDHAPNKISLEAWVKGEFVLVLGCEEAVRAPLDAINRAVFQRAVELILAQPDNPRRRTWVFLDEVREAGKLAGLRSLLNKGRSKGACVVLGFQAIEGLRDAYGDKAAEEIAGECNHKALLRVESPTTAEWESKVVGEFEQLEVKKSQPPGGGPPSLSEDLTRRASVLPSEFTDLPVTNRTNGLTGYFVNPVTGAYKHTITAAELDARLVPPAAAVPNYMPRPDEHQYLRPWDADDRARLGLSAPPASPPPGPPAPPPQPSPKQKLKEIGKVPGTKPDPTT
jgi:hypothetical protein